MAVKKTTTTQKTAGFAKKVEPVAEEVVTEVNSSVSTEDTEDVKETVKQKVKTFSPDDMILCQSVCVGQTFVKGIKTGQIYTFEALGAEEYIEYKDLVAAVRSKDGILYKPFIVVMDEDFLNEQTKLKQFYNSMYTPKDFEDFFKLNPSQMKEALDNMPIGIRETIKSMAAGKIQDGTFDSVARIRALDEYFGTKLMLLTELYNED